MIIKIWQYESRVENVVGGGAKQSLAFSTALSSGCYIYGIDPEVHLAALQSQVRPIGNYVAADRGSPERIAGRYAYNLNAAAPDEQINELSAAAGAAGLKQFWHVTISHREGDKITAEQGEEIRTTFAEVMGVEQCPQLWADHGDTNNDHGHGLIVSAIPESGQDIKFGEGWWKEKAQIAAAICEHRLGLQPEPNRRYVADASGVYHLLTHTKVADPEGKLVLDGKGMRAMQHAHDKIIGENDAPEGHQPGDPWPLERAAQILAKPRLQTASAWPQVHEDLASIGFRYVKVGNTGLLEAVTNGGDWTSCVGIRCAAGDAYANAALGKLSDRLKDTYLPPAPGLVVRPLVMPRFNAPDQADAIDQSNRKEELAEFKALTAQLTTDYKQTYRSKLNTEKGASANEARATRKASHSRELDAVKSARRHVVTPSKVTAAKGQKTLALPTTEISAILWGEPAQGHGATDLLRRQREQISDDYDVKPGQHETRYYLDGKLAIVERERTIQLLSARRQARIQVMLLAAARFREIRIAARRKVREALARIAAELDIEVLPQRLEDTVAIYRTQIKRDPDNGIVARARRWRNNRTTLKRLRSSVRHDRDRRDRSAASFSKATVRDFRRWNEADSDAGCFPNPPKNIAGKALQTLDRIDRNGLHLARSRFNVDGARFLDDPALLSAFKGHERHIILPGIQSRLDAIEAVQVEQRRWIAAALLSGRVTMNNGNLAATQKGDKWAEAFWEGQKGDPSFHRLLAVSHLRPDRFAFDLDERPDVRAWRAARTRGDAQLIGAMAEEFFAASVRHGDAVTKDARDRNSAAPPTAADVSWSYRHELFETMGYDDAEALRRTKGRFAETYRGHVYRAPGEPDREWDKRTRAYERNFGPQSGRNRR
ncbi:hypothetical protein J3454_15345 [Erythrobacter sp. NFXS35]|uniref:relaxase/mobilization nuclease domain-containing protein n=1 Tax=Erythrobacter sp. NFXS35 TaxID=2818436 RepID=UPI0032DF0F57